MPAPPERASHKVRAERVRRRPAGLGAVLLALGIVFALAYVFFLRTPPPMPTPDVQSIQGAYIFESSFEGGDRREDGAYSAVTSGDAWGEMRVIAAGSGQTEGAKRPSAYDARRRSELTATSAWPSGLSYARTIGAWPPVWQVAPRSPLDYQGLAAIVRSAVEDGDRAIGIKPLKEGDRKVWRAAMTFGGSAVEVVVDQVTGIVLWYSRIGGAGRTTFTATADWAAPPRSSAASVLDLPEGARVTTERDTAYRYLPTLAAAAATVGFAPLESTLEPDGYTLRAIAVGRHGTAAELFGGEDQSPPGMVPRPPQDNEVAQLYTRGLTWFSIKMVAASSTPRFAAISREVVTQYAAQGLSHDSAVLQYGAFAGATAHTWYAEAGPTLFVANDEYAVVATGGLTRQELISLAEGLEPLGSG